MSPSPRGESPGKNPGKSGVLEFSPGRNFRYEFPLSWETCATSRREQTDQAPPQRVQEPTQEGGHETTQQDLAEEVSIRHPGEPCGICAIVHALNVQPQVHLPTVRCGQKPHDDQEKTHAEGDHTEHNIPQAISRSVACLDRSFRGVTIQTIRAAKPLDARATHHVLPGTARVPHLIFRKRPAAAEAFQLNVCDGHNNDHVSRCTSPGCKCEKKSG